MELCTIRLWTIEFDIAHDSLFVMKNEKKEIIACISIDHDDEVDALPCWSNSLQPSAELARVCVRKDMQGQGIAKMMMEYAFTKLRKQNKKSVHILVRTCVLRLCLPIIVADIRLYAGWNVENV